MAQAPEGEEARNGIWINSLWNLFFYFVMENIEKKNFRKSAKKFNFQANDWFNTLQKTSSPRFWFTRKRTHYCNVFAIFSQVSRNTGISYTLATRSVEMVPGYCKYVSRLYACIRIRIVEIISGKLFVSNSNWWFHYWDRTLCFPIFPEWKLTMFNPGWNL